MVIMIHNRPLHHHLYVIEGKGIFWFIQTSWILAKRFNFFLYFYSSGTSPKYSPADTTVTPKLPPKPKTSISSNPGGFVKINLT